MRWGDEARILQVPRADWQDDWGPFPEDQTLAGKVFTVLLTDEREGLTSLLVPRGHGDAEVIWPTKYLEPKTARVQ